MGIMQDDPRQMLKEQLMGSELVRKEKQIQLIKSLPLGLGFYVIVSLVVVSIVVGLSREGLDHNLILLLIVSCLLVLLDVLSNIRCHQKVNALMELIGEEKLRRLTPDHDNGDPEDY